MKHYLHEWREQAGDKEAINNASDDIDALSNEARNKVYPGYILLKGFVYSVASSALLVLRKGIRMVPPLVTAVVVVFVTSDAWRILGTGFTPRFFFLVALFLLGSLLFLIKYKNYWEADFDINASDKSTVNDLLDQVEHDMQRKQEARPPSQGSANEFLDDQKYDVHDTSGWRQLNELIDLGADPVPLARPARRGGRVCHYCGYFAVSLFSLIVVAVAVSASLILVGVILISAKETKDLAQSIHIYWTLPGHLVITRQLVSLSLSLGAFATLFLVAGQRTEDRKVLMDNALALFRKAFVVYSVYSRAHDSAMEWTGVPVNSPPLSPEVQEPDRHNRHSAANPDARSRA